MEELKSFLSSIGLGKNEVDVYISLVGMGQSSVLEISKKTGIHRSNIYESLEKLSREGLVFAIDKPKKTFYARDPRSLLDYIKQKEVELNSIVDNFEKKFFRKEQSLIGLTKGKFAVREALKSLFEKKQPIYVYGIPDKAPKIIGPIIKEYHKDRIKNGVVMKHIYNSKAEKRIRFLNKLKFTEAKYLPTKYDSIITTNISGDKVVLISWDDDLSVIEIIDKKIAEAYYNYFEILWSQAKSI